MSEVSKLIGLKRQARAAGWEKDWTLADEDALLKGCIFDESEGYAPVDFIESFCVQSQGRWAGKKVELFPWQQEDFLIPLYGWLRPDGTRRYRQAYLEIAKKNGKSTLCSALQIYGLVGDGEAGAEVYSAATTRDQARIVYTEAANMVDASPVLRSKLDVIRSTNTIKLGNNAWIKALSADAASSEGKKIHKLIIDELHVWKDATFLNSLRWGGAGRLQPLNIKITTKGDDLDSLWGQTYVYAKKISKGEAVNFEYLPVIYEPEEGADIEAEETHRAGNPSMDLTINYTDFKQSLQEAKDMGPSDLANFKRYRLNILAGADEVFFDVQRFKEESQIVNIPDAELAELPCWAGLDLAAKEDTTAYIKIFGLENGTWYIKAHFWVPEDKIKRETSEGRNAYARWAEIGQLDVIPGPTIDQSVIFDRILEDYEKFRIQALAFDRWNSDQLIRELTNRGVEAVEFPQTYAYFSGPTKHFQAALLNNKLFHEGNGCFVHQLGNVVVDEDSNANIRPVKRKNKKRFKIDGPVAAIMAFSLCMNHEATPPSRFETEDSPLIHTF